MVDYKKVVYLEGPDRAGKTSVANYLVDKGFKYFHATYSKGMNVLQHHQDIINQVLECDEDVVLDRLCLSEYVYSLVFRNGVWYGRDNYDKLINQVQPTHQIIVLPERDEYLKNIKRDLQNEMYKDLEQNLIVYDIYDMIQKDKTYGSWRRFDYTKESYDELYSYIQKG